MDCAICFKNIASVSYKQLPCDDSHVFHMSCIDSWLLYHPTCPLCRADVPQDLTPVGIHRCNVMMSGLERIFNSLRPRVGQLLNTENLEMTAIAARLGFPSPGCIIPGMNVLNLWYFADFYMLFGDRASNWLPLEWTKIVEETHDADSTFLRNYNKVNTGTSAIIQTQAFKPPTVLNNCPRCGMFITNIKVAMENHYRTEHFRPLTVSSNKVN